MQTRAPWNRLRGYGVAAVCLVCLVCVAGAWAQDLDRNTLTPKQIEAIREAGIYPVERIKLYTKFVNEHMDEIKSLAGRPASPARAKKMDDELQNVTSLMDELGSNLDQYSERKADLRKSLKPLNEATQRWLAFLKGLPSERTFELSRKEAIDSGQDLADQVGQVLQDQTAYFKAHKDERGQERAEPKD